MPNTFTHSSVFTNTRDKFSFQHQKTGEIYSFAIGSLPDRLSANSDKAIQLTSLCSNSQINYDFFRKLLINNGIDEALIEDSGEPKMHSGSPNSNGWGIYLKGPGNIVHVAPK